MPPSRCHHLLRPNLDGHEVGTPQIVHRRQAEVSGDGIEGGLVAAFDPIEAGRDSPPQPLVVHAQSLGGVLS